MVLSQNTAGVTADDRKRLDVVGEIRLGEMVNQIRKVEVEESPNAVVVPRAFMGTVSQGVPSSFSGHPQLSPVYYKCVLRMTCVY